MLKLLKRVSQETEEGRRKMNAGFCVSSLYGAFMYYWEDLDIGNISLNCIAKLYFQTVTIKKKETGILFVIKSVLCESLFF